jgi:hypothetical protein
MFFVFLGAAAANGDNKLVMVGEAVHSHGSQDALSAISDGSFHFTGFIQMMPVRFGNTVSLISERLGI